MPPARLFPSETRPAPVADPGPPGPVDLLPASWRRHLVAIVAVSVLWSSAWAVAVYDGRRPLALERPLNDLLTNSRPRLGHVADAFVSINKPLVFAGLMLLMLGLCAGGRSIRAVATLAVALTVTVSLCEMLKGIVGRTNTYGVLTFPSGHVGVTSVLATVAILLARRRGPLGRHLPIAARVAIETVAAASVLAVAVSMVVLGGHFVTDTIAAAPIGLAVTVVAGAAADALTRVPAPSD